MFIVVFLIFEMGSSIPAMIVGVWKKPTVFMQVMAQ